MNENNFNEDFYLKYNIFQMGGYEHKDEIMKVVFSLATIHKKFELYNIKKDDLFIKNLIKKFLLAINEMISDADKYIESLEKK